MNHVHPPNKQAYFEQVWELVRQIPHGMVVTYGQITKLLPRPESISAEDYQINAARWVGMAMSACPQDVPWQRVINSQGKVSYRSEAAKQKQLLQSEGVLFFKDKLDLSEYQWHGPGVESEQVQSVQGKLF